MIAPGKIDQEPHQVGGAQRSSNDPNFPTYVVIPVRDRNDLTGQVLGDLHHQGGYQCIFVFDNGSNEENGQQLRELARSLDTQIQVSDATGWNLYAMWNAGVKWALRHCGDRAFNVAILNNDLLIGPDFLNGLAWALRSDETMWAISPNYDHRQGSGIESVRSTYKNRGLAGFAFMVRGEQFARHKRGLAFDEKFHWWFGDDDFVAQVERKGGRVGIALDVTVEHVKGGGQTSRQHPIREELIQADRERMFLKWYDHRPAWRRFVRRIRPLRSVVRRVRRSRREHSRAERSR